jgi:exopolysaccharide biosynthesis polyprenyl glycosylphosphotransferase
MHTKKIKIALIYLLLALDVFVIFSVFNHFAGESFATTSAIAWIILFYAFNNHRIIDFDSSKAYLKQFYTPLFFQVMLFFLMQTLFGIELNKIFLATLLFVLHGTVLRLTFFNIVKWAKEKGKLTKNLVLIGEGELKDIVFEKLTSGSSGYRIAKVLSYSQAQNFNTLHEIINENGIQEIFFCETDLKFSVEELIEFSDKNFLKFKYLQKVDVLKERPYVYQRIGDISVYNINEIPLDVPINQAIKRIFDILFASIVSLLILSWLFPLIALIIRLDSKGPVFFRQKRHGKNNKYFYCYKFRTMFWNEADEFYQARKDDERITKIGRILRRLSLDELPQFLNVLEGHMSVVGPRPHPVKLNEQFQSIIEKFWQRHSVKPGITGLAQAKGYRGETITNLDMSNRVRLDRFYIRNWSVVFDVKIVLLTIISLLKGNEKAY